MDYYSAYDDSDDDIPNMAGFLRTRMRKIWSHVSIVKMSGMFRTNLFFSYVREDTDLAVVRRMVFGGFRHNTI